MFLYNTITKSVTNSQIYANALFVYVAEGEGATNEDNVQHRAAKD